MKGFKTLSNEQMNAIKGGYTVMGSGTDEGGDFIIIDDGNSCTKYYNIGDFTILD